MNDDEERMERLRALILEGLIGPGAAEVWEGAISARFGLEQDSMGGWLAVGEPRWYIRSNGDSEEEERQETHTTSSERIPWADFFPV